jgi:membrane-anchored protein YejM (alkaline phosphatase superfamily)
MASDDFIPSTITIGVGTPVPPHGTIIASDIDALQTLARPIQASDTNFIPGLTIKHLIDYKYNEGESLKEIQSYIDATYEQHYSRNKFQATEFIIDAGHGTGFNIGNMMKYTQRYGRKGDPAEWRKDLMKVIHYAIMQLHVHDTENKD